MITFAEVHIDVCTSCGGFWFDNHELSWLAQRAPDRLLDLHSQYMPSPDTLPPSPFADKLCPLCRVTLASHEFAHCPGVVMDVCARCHGIWLDHGKLALIDRHLKQRRRQSQDAQPVRTPSSSRASETSVPSPPSTATPRPVAKTGMRGAPARKCIKCAHPNKPDAKICEKCGAVMPLTGRWKPGYCPRCHLGMYPARRSGYLLQACSRCQGIWLPHALLRELLEQHLGLLRNLDTDFQLHYHTPVESATMHRCPDCYVDLIDEKFATNLPGDIQVETTILTHRCPDCQGVWFDAGELHAIWKEITEQQPATGEAAK